MRIILLILDHKGRLEPSRYFAVTLNTLCVGASCCVFVGIPSWMLYLVKEQLSPLLPPQVHHLYRHLSATVLLSSNADHPRRALPNLHKVLQVRSWIALVDHHLQGRLELLMGHFGWVWWWPG